MTLPTSLSRRTLLTHGMAGGALIVMTSPALAHMANGLGIAVDGGPAGQRPLTPMQFYVLRRGGTEQPFSHPLTHERRDGVYGCAGCGEALFTSAARIDSALGWPSFSVPITGAITLQADHCAGYPQLGVLCRTCGGHLGHIHAQENGARLFAVNGNALIFANNDKSTPKFTAFA
jgi:peptide-methionine (R)-S-oxide reductase